MNAAVAQPASNAPLRFAVLDDYQRAAERFADWSRLPQAVDLTVFHDRVEDLDALVDRLRLFHIVMAMRERTMITRDVLERLPQLQMLVNAGMRAPGIDVDAATELGIVVCGTPGEGEGPTQLAWALLLALARHLVEEDRSIREGAWGSSVGVDLTGKTIGLVGLGKIGSQMAAVALAFGMRVLAWSANLTHERAAEHGVELVDKETLFREADVVSLHLRLSDRTRGIVGASELALMKPTALFVNTARGALVDEAALVAALADQRLAGAALDVFDTEPLPRGHPLLGLPNTLLTPHIGYVTDVRCRSYYQGAVDAVEAFVGGRPIRVLNPHVLGHAARRR